MIRPSTVDDAASMVDMAERFHQSAPLPSPLGFSRLAAAQTFLAVLDNPDCLALTLDLGRPRGALLAHLAPYPLSGVPVAKEIVFWVDPDARGPWARQMVESYEAWSRARGARLAGLSCFADGRTHLLFQRLGFRVAEINTVKEL